MSAHYGYPTHAVSPQAYRRLRDTLQPCEASDLADDIADALQHSGVCLLSTADRILIYGVLRRGAQDREPQEPMNRDTYIDEVQTLAESFYYQLCDNCHGDLIDHVISPDPLGHAHLFCTKEAPE